MRRWAVRSGCVAAGVLGALLAVELLMRVVRPYNADQAGVELPLFRGDTRELEALYELDPELGFRPLLATRAFAASGAQPNDYSLEQKRPGTRRILFLGDSVVFRGRLVRALRATFGEGRHEFWSAGVSAFNTRQEVEYFRRYLGGIRPDVVVLVFHPNDFMSTPISFRDGDGRMRVIALSRPLARMPAALFRFSYVYRYYLGVTRHQAQGEALAEIRSALEDLRALCLERGAGLEVIHLPHLAPLEEWTPVVREQKELMCALFDELQLPHFDLVEPLREALGLGLDVQESPGDHAHPSDAVCEVFARTLLRDGLLSGR